jgi:hypothetical protein
MIGALSFTILIAGHMIMSAQITEYEQRLERLQNKVDGRI